MGEGEWEESLYCPRCNKDTTFFMCEFEDLNENVVEAMCSVCEVEMEQETKWVVK